MKLVVTDGYTINPGDLSWEPLKEFGELVVFDHSPRDEEEMIRRIGDADILVANKAKVSRRVRRLPQPEVHYHPGRGL